MDWQQEGTWMTHHVNDLAVVGDPYPRCGALWRGVVWYGKVWCCMVSWCGMVRWLIPLPSSQPLFNLKLPPSHCQNWGNSVTTKTEYSLKDIWPIIQSYDLNLCIIIIIFMRACYTWFRRIKIGGWETPGNFRPLSVSFQFRASGKEFHSQAGSTRLGRRWQLLCKNQFMVLLFRVASD